MANFTERGLGAGLWALNRLANLEVLDRVGLREQLERALFRASKTGFRTAGAAGRTFGTATKLGRPARQTPTQRGGLFDLTPTDEQQMLGDAVEQFAAERVRPAAQEADAASETPQALLDESAELGLTMLGVPEELGGVVSERSAVTAVLLAEAYAHGDMGIAVAALAPAAVSAAIGLWGDEEQQGRYLPPFFGEAGPAAALAILEARPLFDPFKLETRARRVDGGFALDGRKSLVPLAASAELFLVAAQLDAEGPALFIVESGTGGVFVEPEPAMGIRAAATGRLVLEDVRLPDGALLGEGGADVYSECVQRARIAWSAVAVGTAQAVLDYVIPYVNERVAFGEPISHRQSVAFAIADIAIELEGMRLATYRAAGRADQGKEFARETALARRLTTDKGMGIGSDGVQLLGGHGYVKEHPVERWYRDLRAAGLMEGALLV